MRPLRPFVLLGATVLAAGCNGGSAPLVPPRQVNLTVGCADMNLRVEPGGWQRERSAGSGTLPTIGVDLVDTAGAESTLLSLAPCDGEVQAATRSVPGSASFVVDSDWLAGAAPAGCLRLTATAMRFGVAAGHGTLTLRRGDFTVDGTVTAPGATSSAAPVAAPSAHVTALVGRLRLRTEADENGHFVFDHVPAGRLFLVAAKAATTPGVLPPAGQATPGITLGSSTPSATVDVRLHAPVPAIDRFEPDDTVADAGLRTGLGVGATEAHTLPTGDIDLVPFAVQSGQMYRLTVSPRTSGAADLALAVVR